MSVSGSLPAWVPEPERAEAEVGVVVSGPAPVLVPEPVPGPVTAVEVLAKPAAGP